MVEIPAICSPKDRFVLSQDQIIPGSFNGETAEGPVLFNDLVLIYQGIQIVDCSLTGCGYSFDSGPNVLVSTLKCVAFRLSI